jgi:hypothetical protein
MKKVITIVIILFLGVALGQALDTIFNQIDESDAADQLANARVIAANYQSVIKAARSAPQISQISDEANVQLNYILIKQNQEVIRLLKKISGETK